MINAKNDHLRSIPEGNPVDAHLHPIPRAIFNSIPHSAELSPFGKGGQGGRAMLSKDAHHFSHRHQHKIPEIYGNPPPQSSKVLNQSIERPHFKMGTAHPKITQIYADSENERRQASAKVCDNPENLRIISFPSLALRAHRHPPSSTLHPLFFPSSILPPEFQT